MPQTDKVTALVETGIGRLEVMEWVEMNKACCQRCLSRYLGVPWLVVVLCQPVNRINFSLHPSFVDTRIKS